MWDSFCLYMWQEPDGVLEYNMMISTHSLTDKIPDSGSGAGGSIPSGCIETKK